MAARPIWQPASSPPIEPEQQLLLSSPVSVQGDASNPAHMLDNSIVDPPAFESSK